jgi:hypothetical protein
LLRRSGPIHADEVEAALRNADFEVVFVVDSKKQVISQATQYSPDKVVLPDHVAKAARRRVSIHNHPGGGGPTIEDIVTGIRTGAGQSWIVTPTGKYIIDFGNISSLSKKEQERLAYAVRQEIQQILERNIDEVLDEAINKIGEKRGFSVVFERQ